MRHQRRQCGARINRHRRQLDRLEHARNVVGGDLREEALGPAHAERDHDDRHDQHRDRRDDLVDAPHRKPAHEQEDDERRQRDRDGQHQHEVDQHHRIKRERLVILPRERDEERQQKEKDDGCALCERFQPARDRDAQLRARTGVIDVEIEVGEERADRGGHAGGEEDDAGDEEHEAEQIAQQAEREERRFLLDVRDRREEAHEQHEVADEERRECDGDDDDAHRIRRIVRAEAGERDSERPHIGCAVTRSRSYAACETA